jgi:class 3 adenylate cyclase/tetratricopeptide (TPR) repeat protein
LNLAVLDDGAGGLILLLTDGRSLVQHERLALPAAGLSAWAGDAWSAAATEDDLRVFGQRLADLLLPAPLRAVLAGQPAGSLLQVQLGETLAGLPWELAALPFAPPSTDTTDPPAVRHLDDHFTVVRRILATGLPPAGLRHREPGTLLQVLHGMTGPATADETPRPGRFGPLVLRVQASHSATPEAWLRAVAEADIVHLHGEPGATGPTTGPTTGPAAGSALAAAATALCQPTLLAGLPLAPRLLIAEGLPLAAAAALANAAGRVGLSLLTTAVPSPLALTAFYAALADGETFGRAAQCARSAARRAQAVGDLATPGRPGARGALWAPGVDAWFYGDGGLAPLRAAAGLAAQMHYGAKSAGLPAAADDDVRQVTILACDLVDSTGLMQRLGDEEYSERLTHYHQRVAGIARQHDGLADDPQGDDGFMCYFGYPVASEDAAAAALRAGLALSGALDDLGLAVRIGISTGRVVIRNGQPVGAAVHHAARLQSRAGAGGVLLSASTRLIAGERFEFSLESAVAQLKGFAEGGAVYRVHRERPVQGTERFDNRADLTSFIGRDAEMQQLRQRWALAAGGERQILLLVGEAGIGKSRLVREFRQGLDMAGVRTLECRCAPEHTGSAFQPLIDVLRRRLQIQVGDDPDQQVQRLRMLEVTTGPGGDEALTLLGTLMSVPADRLPPLADPAVAASPERQRQRTKALLMRASQGLTGPVCLIFEDVHWIDPSTRELVQRMIDGPRQQPLLLLLTQRSGPVTVDAGFAVPTLALAGLGADAARALVQGAIGSALLATDLVRWLAARSDGVPLFIEESARMAAVLAASQPTADVASSLRDSVPDTLQDLLMARLDQLPLAKRAAQMGGALGRSFSQALIEAVNAHADSPIRLPALDQELAALARAGLLGVQGEGAGRQYMFKHSLVRDAAHQSLLERDRRRLHAAIADVLQHQFAALCDSQPEQLALHQELAGLTDAALLGWERAARHATQRSSLDEAIAHLRRALRLVVLQTPGPDRDRAELRLLLPLASRLIATAGYGAEAVQAVYGRALALGQALDDPVSLTKARLGLGGYHYMRGDLARALVLARQVEASLGDQPAPRARVQSTWAQANVLFSLGQLRQAMVMMDRCRAEHSRLGHRPAAVQDPAVMCLCYASWALWALGLPDQALASAQQAVALAETLAHRFSIGQGYGFLGVVHHLRGETAAGLLAIQRALEVSEAGGFAVWLAHARVMHGRLQAEQGALALGLAAMDEGHALWAATGAVVTQPLYLVLRAEGLSLAGRPDEALALVEQAHALVERHGERCHAPEVHRLRGELLRQAGAPVAEAEHWLQAGLDCAVDLQLHGMALKSAIALAQTWQGRGQAARASELLGRHLAHFTEGLQTRDLQVAQSLLAACRVSA